MHRGEDDSPPYISTYQHGPYNGSIASSASSSSASVWSDVASQSSDDSLATAASADLEVPESYCYTSHPTTTSSILPSVSLAQAKSAAWPNPSVHIEAPLEQRRNPRRTSIGAATRTGCPPSLIRQSDRKVSFVDSLVDSSAQIVEAIWPLSSIVCRNEMGSKGVLPLRTFIQETLRRSRTSYSTLQVALYYLVLIKPHVPKHDFTMEQSDESHSARALQCGRRMFLSALILASKYLQDRNYSARAWSKISGLNTLEINQNEMAFLVAVNWKLHITDAVFQRWTDIVLKYTPNQPSSPSSACALMIEQAADWKSIILKLNPELDNLDGILTPSLGLADVRPMGVGNLRSPVSERSAFGFGSKESTPTPKDYASPNILEPLPTSAYPSSKPAPALGLLPTPRLTPPTTGFNTPAVSAASYMLNKSSAMSLAMAQASSASAAQFSERWQPHFTSSPQAYLSHRRSSLANSVSSASSPESMVSDNSSRSSRSSSISSASSVASAPISSKLDVQARCRYAKLCSERNRAAIATVPEDYCEVRLSSSPESYSGPVGKDFLDLSLDTPVARQDGDVECFSKDEEAARALQDLHNHTRAGAKRSRPESMDNTLQENVREMLNGTYQAEGSWSDELLRSRNKMMAYSPNGQVAVHSTPDRSAGRKRVCCATEASRGIRQNSSSLGTFGPGMWEGIL